MENTRYTYDMKTLATVLAIIVTLLVMMLPHKAHALVLLSVPQSTSATSEQAKMSVRLAQQATTTVATTTPALTKKEIRQQLRELRAELKRLERLIRALQKGL